jgi:putative nucleotidyltransferase with HDIG domain
MLKRTKVSADQIQIGMYVAELDRPWLETPFLLQGFKITDELEVEKLKDLCGFVYVDELQSNPGIVIHASSAEKSDRLPRRNQQHHYGLRTDKSESAGVGASTGSGTRPVGGVSKHKKQADGAIRMSSPEETAAARRKMFPGKKLKAYDDAVLWKKEIPNANRALDNLSSTLKEIFSRPDKTSPLDPARLKRAVSPMIDSVIRNPDACIWLAQMKRVDNYMYEHSLATSVWAVALGRQLGLPRQDLQTLAMGGLLLDIGKLHVEPSVINSPDPLTEDEFEHIKQHVDYSVDELERAGFLNALIGEMVQHHHERFDGGGYPQGLMGDEIPVFARIAAIVDSYDAMTSNRVYAQAMAPAAAIKQLYDSKGGGFQAELVEEFIQAAGDTYFRSDRSHPH